MQNNNNNLAELTESIALTGKLTSFAAECWFNDACISDTDYFIKLLSGIQGKGVHPDLIGSIIAHYASKRLPDLAAAGDHQDAAAGKSPSPESATGAWMKKRFFIETLVGILPPEKDSVPCAFLLRALRVANMVGADGACRAELERRVAWQLDQAAIGDLMIPCFSHMGQTLLDVGLVVRLVRGFVGAEEVARSGAALVKVARLVDAYLAEAAVDSNLGVCEFVELACALPNHARCVDDGLYRAIDTYLKAHPGLSKQERKSLCSLIDSRKLSSEASLHAAQNERLPARAVIQILLSEQSKLIKTIDWSGSLSGARSPAIGLDGPARCFSKREMTTQQMEVRRLKEDVLRLQSQCMSMEMQIERLLEKKNNKGYFSWKKLGFNKAAKVGGVEGEGGEASAGFKTPARGRTSNKWSESLY